MPWVSLVSFTSSGLEVRTLHTDESFDEIHQNVVRAVESGNLDSFSNQMSRYDSYSDLTENGKKEEIDPEYEFHHLEDGSLWIVVGNCRIRVEEIQRLYHHGVCLI